MPSKKVGRRGRQETPSTKRSGEKQRNVHSRRKPTLSDKAKNVKNKHNSNKHNSSKKGKKHKLTKHSARKNSKALDTLVSSATELAVAQSQRDPEAVKWEQNAVVRQLLLGTAGAHVDIPVTFLFPTDSAMFATLPFAAKTTNVLHQGLLAYKHDQQFVPVTTRARYIETVDTDTGPRYILEFRGPLRYEWHDLHGTVKNTRLEANVTLRLPRRAVFSFRPGLFVSRAPWSRERIELDWMASNAQLEWNPASLLASSAANELPIWWLNQLHASVSTNTLTRLFRPSSSAGNLEPAFGKLKRLLNGKDVKAEEKKRVLKRLALLLHPDTCSSKSEHK